MEFFKKWIDVLASPKKILKKESKSKKLNEALIHLIVAGLIAGAISGLLPVTETEALRGALGGGMFFVTMLIITPLFFILFWAVSSAVLYVFARALAGKGMLVPQSHLIALINAPFGVLNALVDVVPTLGGVLSLLVSLWSLWVLTLGLKEVHKYSTSRAVLTWLIPLVLLVLIIVVLVFLGFFGGLV